MTINFIEEDLLRLKTFIEDSDQIVLLPHTSPDGDALGATGAWFDVLTTAYPNKEVFVVSPDDVEAYLSWLPFDDHFVSFYQEPENAVRLIQEADLILHLDHNQVKRIRYPELISAVYDNTKANRVLIDHHELPDNDFDLVFSYPELSSTCELSFMLIKELDYKSKLSAKGATFLLSGLVTDTGRFMYACFYPEIFQNFSELLALGADYPMIIDRLSYHNKEAQLRLQGYMLDKKMDLYPELRTAILMLSQDEMIERGITKGDTEGLVNLPLTIEGIDSCCFIREDKSQIKLSFRSIGDFPVNRLAMNGFGGGGHINAAGAEFNGSLEEAKNIYLYELKALLEQRDCGK